MVKKMEENLKPTKVIKVFCPKCGELQVKIYPWSSFRLKKGAIIPNCRKCIAEHIKKERKIR